MKLQHKNGSEEIVEVKVQSVVSTTYIVVATSLSIPPYIIENHSDETIFFHQTMGGRLQELPSHHKIPFTWDIPAGTQMICLRDPTTLREKNEFCEIDLNKDGLAKSLIINKRRLLASVATNGPSSVLKITNFSKQQVVKQEDCNLTIEIYENQRRLMLGVYSKANLLKTDRAPWTDNEGRVVDKNNFKLPDKSWRWATGEIFNFFFNFFKFSSKIVQQDG